MSGESFHIRVKQRLGDFTMDVDVESGLGGVTAFFGPSGAGKTSLINAVAGLSVPDEAYIRIGDRVLTDTANGNTCLLYTSDAADDLPRLDTRTCSAAPSAIQQKTAV